MRPLSLLAACAALVLSAAARAGDPPASPPAGPSPELVKTACGQGLLVRDEKPEAGGDFDGDAGGSFSGLFGGSGDKDKKGKGEKPKPRLLRPRSAKDKDACPGRMKDLYEKYGDRLSAVPAPGGVDAAEIEAHIDRVYELSASLVKPSALSAIQGGSVDQRRQAIARLFDGVKTLDAAGFDKLEVNRNDPAVKKAAALLAGGLGPDESGATPVETVDPAEKEAEQKKPDQPLSVQQRKRWAQKTVPPEPGTDPPMGRSWTSGYAPPSVGTWEPPAAAGAPAERPVVADNWNRYAPELAQDLAGRAGSWTADKIWGGGDPAVSVEMPPDGHSPEYYRRVRYGNYGTQAMIAGLVATMNDMGRLHAPTVLIGDISQKGGGSFRRHLSHKVGKDVDVFFITDSRGRFDVPWNLALAAAAMRHMNVTRIFVDTRLKNMMTQYLSANRDLPQAERAAMAAALGKMQYWPGHDTHFHIRIDY